jgi:hypothetical protein
MSIAKNSFGTLFKIGDGAGPEVFTTIPEVSDVNAPNVKTDLNDVTSHDSPGAFREFLPGLHDGETITAPYNWVPSNAIHVQLRVDAYASTLRNFKITFPDTAHQTVSFAGYVIGTGNTAKMGDPLKGTVQVKVTGLPAWS